MKFLFNILFVTFLPLLAHGQDKCFPKTEKHVFVYDQANILKPIKKSLQNTLSIFTQQTSNTLVIVTTNNLCGYDKSTYAIEFGDQNGVGQMDKDNGIVLLIKPKTAKTKGQVFIAVGTGLQGVITDVTANRVIHKEIIPHFKTGDYSTGVVQGSNLLMKLAKKEFSQNDYNKEDNNNSIPVVIIFLIFIFIIFLNRHRRTTYYDREGVHRIGRNYGNNHFGGGGFSGGGSGGFGGGGFSGGGSGGSW